MVSLLPCVLNAQAEWFPLCSCACGWPTEALLKGSLLNLNYSSQNSRQQSRSSCHGQNLSAQSGTLGGICCHVLRHRCSRQL